VIRFCTPLLLLILAPLFFSCSKGSDERATHRFRVFQDDGVTVARTIGGPKYREELFNYDHLCKMKEDTSNKDSYLVQPSTILVDDDGMYYVSDRMDSRIAVFDQQGNYIRCFGQRGAGPGDMWLPVLRGIKDGVIEVFDEGLKRLSRFISDGRLIEIVTALESSNLIRLYKSPDNSIIEVTRPYHNDAEYGVVQALVVITDSQKDTVAVIQSDWIPTSYIATVDEDGIVYLRWTLYASARPLVTLAPGIGILVTTGESPELQLYSLSGQHLRTIEIELFPNPVSETEKQAQIDRLDNLIQSTTGTRRVRFEALKKALKIPEYKAYWDRVVVDDRGLIWLRMPELDQYREEMGGELYRIVSLEGEYIVDTRAPMRSGIAWKGQYLTLPSDPESGLITPTAYRLESAIEGWDYQ
jgi:hypothetical protein